MKKLEKGFISGFDWQLYPDTERFLQKEVNRFLRNNSMARRLARKMRSESSTRFFDWIDHIVLPHDKKKESFLLKHRFKKQQNKRFLIYKNKNSIFFPILFHNSREFEIVLKPENVEDFVRKVKTEGKVQGEKYAPLRKVIVKQQVNYLLTAIERRGSNAYVIKKASDINKYKKALKMFATRKRKFGSDREGMIYTLKLVNTVTKWLPKERATDAFFRAERSYWKQRNKAGQIQKARQDKLGLGWGNHDHHTYRSSRNNFSFLVKIFEALGYKCRERFYAGEKAGWGAQILEHPICDIVMFSDVDISKHERHKDFAHEGLPKESKLGTVGLWIGLHGESVLQAGMHHLEARFMFEKLEKDLNKKGLEVMKPFSHFPFLKQAFTKGETWKVEKSRVEKLLREKYITKEQYLEFLDNGAIGSHMENLQRKQGFKGFNQDSVTAVIKATDPRRRLHKNYMQHRGA